MDNTINSHKPMENLFVVMFGFISGIIQFLAGGGYWGNLAEAGFTAFVCALFAAAAKELWHWVRKRYIHRNQKNKPS